MEKLKIILSIYNEAKMYQYYESSDEVMFVWDLVNSSIFEVANLDTSYRIFLVRKLGSKIRLALKICQWKFCASDDFLRNNFLNIKMQELTETAVLNYWYKLFIIIK